MNFFGAFGSLFGIFGTIFNDVICYPLGGLLRVCYMATGNYTISLVLFTLITRCLLFPLAIKQQKGMAEMHRLKPKLDQLQKKYAKDKERLQVEMSKLYQEEGYNPLSGCMPLLFQLPILYGLFTVVYNPLSYIMWYSQDTINKVAEALRPFIKESFNDPKIQLYVAKAMNGHMSLLTFLGQNVKAIDFNFFGLDLSAIPSFSFNILVLIPILCYVTSVLSSFLSFRMNKGMQAGQMGAGMNSMVMVLLLPLMSVWFSVQLPAAVGFYWIVTNIFMVFQVIILNKFFSLDKLSKKAQLNSDKKKQAILDGTAKPSKFGEFTRKALESQNQSSKRSSDESSDEENSYKENNSSKGYSHPSQNTHKVNSKGKKSRSQLKAEQRNRLAKSRSKDNRK